MPDEAGLVVEGSGFDLRRGYAGDVTGNAENVGGDVAELCEILSGRGAEEVDGECVGEVDAGIPEAEAELPEVELEVFVFDVGVLLREQSEGLSEMGGVGLKQGAVGDGGVMLQLFD